MKIMITHIPNTFNYGSAMMAINLIYYLNDKFKGNVEFYTDCRTEEDLNNLLNSTGITNIEINKVFPDKSKLILEGKDVNLDKTWLNAYCNGITSNYNCFIVLGGDDLSEYYSKESVVSELYKINKISKVIPVFLLGQTIGPFTEWRKEHASNMLKGVKIYTRDSITYDYLLNDLNLSSKDIKKSSDLAFLELPTQKEINYRLLLDRFDLKEDQYISIIPSGLVNHYTDSYEKYIDNWVSIIEYLISEKNTKVVLLPHVLRPDVVDDRKIIDEILKKIDNRYLSKLVYIEEKLLPVEARLILGNGLFSISGRMHGAVSTFQMGKSSISLSYSVKYKGVIGQGLDCQDLIIESSNYIWRTDEIKELVIKKIDYVIDNYSDIVDRINHNVNKCEKDVLNMIDSIYQDIKEETNE